MRTSITQAVADVATPTRSGAAAPIADRAGGVFLVYEGVHLLAGLLLFPKLPTVYLLRQPSHSPERNPHIPLLSRTTWVCSLKVPFVGLHNAFPCIEFHR